MKISMIQKKKGFAAAVTILSALLCCIAALALFAAPAKAADDWEPVYPDVTDSATDWTYLGIPGSYITDAQDALDRINEIRLEACTEGVPDPRNSSRNLMAADYVPIKWSSDLERIARIRATESSLTMNHVRLNKGSVFNVSSNGISGSGEVLAWNWSQSMVSGVDQWYEEKADWVSQNLSNDTGHYTAMINPANSYVGLGTFYTEFAGYYNTTAGQFSQSKKTLDSTMLPAKTNVMQFLEVSNSYIQENVLQNGSDTEEGTTKQITAKVKLTTGHTLFPEGTMTYQSSNPSVAEVDADGMMTAKKTGTAVITAYLDGKEFVSQTIEITCRHDFVKVGEKDEEGYTLLKCSKCGETKKVILPTTFAPYFRNSESTSMYYSSRPAAENPVGSEILVWITSIDGGTGAKRIRIETSDPSVLKAEPLLDVEQSSETSLKALKAGVVTLTLSLDYDPSVSKSYLVSVGNNGDLDINDCEILLNQDTFIHTKKAIRPTVTVSYNGQLLASGTHYSVSYSDNTEVGTGCVTITGKGLFEGSEAKAYFTIRHDLKETQAVNPTCTEPGNITYYTCSVCNGYFTDPEGNDQITKADTIVPAKGHTEAPAVKENEVQPTCTSKGSYESVVYCGECGVELSRREITVDEVPHTEETIPGTEPTCTETGLTEGSRCSVCEQILTAQEIIPAKGHTSETVKGYAPTCTEEGLTDGTKCSTCNAILIPQEIIPATGHDWSEWVTELEATMEEDGLASRICNNGCGERQEKVIPAGTHDHRMERVEKVDETCFEDGHIAYWFCTFCENMFADENGETELAEEDIVIKKHHVPEVIPEVPATCETEGLTEGSRCSVCKEILLEQAVTDKLGHSWQSPEWKWSGYDSAKAVFVCKRDAGHVETVEGTITNEVTAEPQNGKDGKEVFTAEAMFNGEIFTDRKTRSIPYIFPEAISLNKKTAETATGQTLQLKATMKPENATEPEIIWTSSNPKVATVDKNGKVKALKRGTVVITAAAKADMDKAVSCKITVLFSDATHENVSKEMFTAIYWASDHKITGETVAFGTNNSMTRGQFVRFLYRYAGNPKITSSMVKEYGSAFRDVDDTYTHYKAIVWAVSKGLIAGYSDGTFKPNKTLSRNNVATILWKYAGEPKVSNVKKPFTDVTKSVALAWGKSKKIFTGTKFEPKANCLRGDFAVFLYRYDNMK